jgi:RES domain
MIVFRQTDARYPFLWEGTGQPAGRWHGEGEGPAHYFSDTPHGAWAEFLRHEEITEPADLETVRRQIWAVDIGDAEAESVRLARDVTTGGLESYGQCQAESRRLRARGARRLIAPSAALTSGGASGTIVDNGSRSASPRDGRVIVVFGLPRDLVGWVVADAARPTADLLDRVHHFPSR